MTGGRALAAALAVTALAGTPAQARTLVAREVPAAGPVLAPGGMVAWGERLRGGDVRVRTRRPGRSAEERYRAPAPRGAGTTRGFGGKEGALAATRRRLAAVVTTATVTGRGSDFVSTTEQAGAVGGRLRGPLELLSGLLPDRAGGGPCRPGDTFPGAVAADGDRLAIAEAVSTCTRTPDPLRVRVLDGDRTTSVEIPVDQPLLVRRVALAGRFLAYNVQAFGGAVLRIVVRDLAAGADVLSVTAETVDAIHLGDFGLQADGTLAFTYTTRKGGDFPTLVAWTRPGRSRPARLAVRTDRDRLALSGDRVLVHRDRRADFASDLVLVPLRGGRVRRLRSFDESLQPLGGFDLRGRWATWAEQRSTPREAGAGRYPEPAARPKIVRRRVCGKATGCTA